MRTLSFLFRVSLWRFRNPFKTRHIEVNRESDDKGSVIIIRPRSGWQLMNFKELGEYTDLCYFLIRRDVKVLYAQTILGFSWAILQPLIQIVIFTVVFGNVAGLSTEGIPYLVFSSVAVIPWTYMAQAMTESSQSLINNQHILGKVYFPRLIFPLTPIFSRLLDFAISVLILLAIVFYYRITPTWNLVFLPLFLIMMMSIPAGIGMWLSALAIRFRDVKHAMPFVVRMLIYSAPIVYSASSIPESYRTLYSCNPIVGVIEGFRASFLGMPIPWSYVWPGMITTIIIVISGTFYFKRLERVFVDVI